MRSIGVVGGGIIGLATTDAILEDLSDVSITVYSTEYSPNTTGDVSGGFIYPAFNGDLQSEDDLVRWTKTTVEHLCNLSKEDIEFAKAISPISGYILWKNGPIQIPHIVQKCGMVPRLVEEHEIQKFTKNKYAGGVFFTSWTCNCLVYLPLLMQKLKSKGVRFVKEKISSLHDVAEKGHDVVVNCTGFGAKFLVNDNSVTPIRGQVITARAPWIKHFIVNIDDLGTSYVLPRTDRVVVGGTHTNDSSLRIDHETTKKIWSDACELLPSLRGATLISEEVGLRPGRPSVRIEVELEKTERGKEYIVLHHYGHGGSGVTLHRGSAKQASMLLKRFILSAESRL